MGPLTDFDRALHEAMQVEPSGNFTARIRSRVATAPRESQSFIPRFAIAAMACALLAVVAAGVWRETIPSVADAALPHRDLMVLSEPPRVISSLPDLPPGPRAASRRTDVVVSPSEMQALQQLFAGIITAPPSEPIADELSIPKLIIEPIAPAPSGPEGERQ